MPYLLVIQGANTGQQFPIGGDVELGRAPSCDVVLRDATVSRHHAWIRSSRGRFFLEDQGSHHGTRINGRKLERRRQLEESDEIQLGECVCAFFLAQPPPRPTETRPPSEGSKVLDTQDSSDDDEFAVPRLRALMDLIQTVGVSLDLSESMSRIHSSLMRVLPRARGGCILIQNERGRLAPQVSRDRNGLDREGPNVSRTIVKQVMREAKAVLVDDAWEDPDYGTESVYQLKMRSIMCAPLLSARGEPLGMIHVDANDVDRPFTPRDLRVLVNIANLAGKVVAHARLHHYQLEFERRRHDLDMARILQLQFLPTEPPTLSGYEFAHFYRAADAVGGDYFNYIPLPDGRLAIAIADVAGKGVAAAMVMARLCSDVRYSLAMSPKPAEAVTELNDRMYGQEDYDRFVTLAVLVVDPESHELELVNAGHPPPLYGSPDKSPTPLGADDAGPPLGVAEGWQYAAHRRVLPAGGGLVLYTDGVCDAVDPSGERFGNRRVVEVLQRRRTATGYVAALRQEVERFERDAAQQDDLCIVSATRAPVG